MCVYCNVAGTIFVTTDVYEHSFSNLSVKQYLWFWVHPTTKKYLSQEVKLILLYFIFNLYDLGPLQLFTLLNVPGAGHAQFKMRLYFLCRKRCIYALCPLRLYCPILSIFLTLFCLLHIVRRFFVLTLIFWVQFLIKDALSNFLDMSIFHWELGHFASLLMYFCYFRKKERKEKEYVIFSVFS